MAQKGDILYYDGRCGLCHRAVRFVLNHDRAGQPFRFAPIQGETFSIAFSNAESLPDSMVVQTSGGELLLRSEAWVHIFRHLGRGWKILSVLLSMIPRPLRDALYDEVAAVRHRFFKAPIEVCPVLSAQERERFEP
jgi:predicted DCC family thiol-disulfide oxidoreductase YuxK